jgi:four helix bundle protein
VKYSELLVWQKAMNLVEAVYRATRGFPSNERFGLVSQLQRAAVSVPSNIAEGHGRKSTGAFLQHLSIASGSVMELETQLQIANRLGYMALGEANELLAMTDEIGKMLAGLQSSLNPQS